MDTAIGRLHQYAGAAYRIIEDQFPAKDRTAILALLADLGVGARVANPLLRALSQLEPDEEWRADLRPMGIDWVRRVLSANLSAHLADLEDLIQKTGGRLLEDWDVSNPEAYAHYRRSMELQMQGKLHEAVAEVEKAAQLDPLDPANHFTLGSVKASLGIGRNDAGLVSQGLNALWLAVALDPLLDPPLERNRSGSAAHRQTFRSDRPSAGRKAGMRPVGLPLLQHVGGCVLEVKPAVRGPGSFRGGPRTGP